MSGVIIARPDQGELPIDLEKLVECAREQWGSAVGVRHDPPGLHSVLTLDIDPPGEPFFHIDVMPDSKSINLDGTPEQNLAVAAWLRSLMPAQTPRIIVFDEAWTSHSELDFGGTAESLRTRAVDHSVPGWDTNDPDLQ